MMRSPLEISELSRAHMIEAIMAVIGRTLPRPRQYRERLEQMTEERLRTEYQLVTDELVTDELK